MTSFKKFRVGEFFKPSAAQANAWNDAAISHQQNKNRNISKYTSQMSSASRAPVSNDTGSDLPAFSVLQLTGTAFDPAASADDYQTRIDFTGDEIDDNSTDKIAITQQNLEDGSIDPNAAVSGVTYARLTGPADQTNAGLVEDQTTLEAGPNGICSILYDPGPADEERIGIVRIGQAGAQIKRAIISALGDYNIHEILFTTGGHGEQNITTVDAYVGEEMDYRLSVGQSVLVAYISGNWWIVEAQEGCPSYCVDYPEGQSYVYGWVLAAPVVTCCTEASGVHVMTTSDAGVTYESATFQCGGSGTNRKWIFDGQTVRISPMLDGGNVQYRSDRAIDKCTVQMFRYEPGIFPQSCGTFQESVCMHPLCGVLSCSTCSGMPTAYKASLGGILTHYGSPSSCTWQNEHDASIFVKLQTTGSLLVYDEATPTGYDLEGGASFDCWGVNTYTYQGMDPLPEELPESITVTPASTILIESLCYPSVISHLTVTGTSEVVCTRRPYYQFFEVSGVANGTCTGCSVFNDVFRSTYSSVSVSATSNISTTCGTGSTFYWRISNYYDYPTGSGLTLKVETGLGTLVTYQYDNPSTSYTTANCLAGPVTFDYVSDNGECTSWPASITVYPIL